jgi:hypothetical protein
MSLSRQVSWLSFISLSTATLRTPLYVRVQYKAKPQSQTAEFFPAVRIHARAVTTLMFLLYSSIP